MSNNGNIPFLDLAAPHKELEAELVPMFQKVLRTAGFVGGPMVEQFEREFASFCDTSFCVGVASGTDAVRFALMAAGVKQGDIVITVPHTFIATTEAITQAGARADFVDIDRLTYNMDPRKLESYIETRCAVDQASGKLYHREWRAPITAIVPVHIYGQTADMDPILDLAKKYDLLVIEDACQAHGAKYFSKSENRWRIAGSMGNAAAFSFYPGKNLGACGEAGAVTTNSEETARKMRMMRDHGQSKKYYHDIEGYNGRLDSLQAGILSVKLKYLSDWNECRRQRALKYNELLASAGANIDGPFEAPWSRAVYHLYVVQVEQRAALQAALAKENIGTGIHYPIPLHLQKAYAHLGYKAGDFPVCEMAAEQILSLPMYPGLSEVDQERVVKTLVNLVQHTTQQPAAGVLA